jgi:hypothetical protein
MLTLNWYLYNSEFGDMQISGANLMENFNRIENDQVFSKNSKK